MYSDDLGINWYLTAALPGYDLRYHGFAYGNGIFVGVAENCYVCDYRVITSTNILSS